MPSRSELEAAFDAAIAQTRTSINVGMMTSDGQEARPLLKKLEEELTQERQRAVDGARVDRTWVQSTVRWLVEWVPETDPTLIAALGRIARASAPGIT